MEEYRELASRYYAKCRGIDQMKPFKVEVIETLLKVVEVQALDEYDALRKVEDNYNNENIVLDSNDFVRVQFEISE